MSMIYTTIDGDVLDAICYRTYGTTSNQIVEAVLNANHGLADKGIIFSAGAQITLPDLEVNNSDVGSLSLWD